MTGKSTFVSIFVLVLLMIRCAPTYHLTKQSLVEQFANAHEEKKTYMNVKHVGFIPIIYPTMAMGNDLTQIDVQDKDGKNQTLALTNTTGVRIFTVGSEKAGLFHLNTLLLKDSTVTGRRDGLFGAKPTINPINLNTITKIEVYSSSTPTPTSN